MNHVMLHVPRSESVKLSMVRGGEYPTIRSQHPEVLKYTLKYIVSLRPGRPT